MNLDETWQEAEWEKLFTIVSSNPTDYKDDFSGWLQKRPGLWHGFVEYGLKAIEKNDPYGFSAVSLLGLLHWDYSPEEYELAKGDYQHAGDLGRLLVAIHPETYESLWRGERYVHPIHQYEDDYVAAIEEMDSSLKGFFVTDEPYRSGPECSVFPELANLPAAEPFDDDGHA